MTPLHIRRATLHDAEAVARLGADTFIETFGHLYPKQDLDDFLAGNHTPEKLRDSLVDTDVAIWVADRDGELVGYAQAGPADMPHPELSSDHGELKRLYVRGGEQSSGVGAALMTPVLEWCEAQGRTPVWISVWSQNEGAQRFYARYGFHKVGEYQFAVGSWKDDEFIMRRG